MAVKTPFSQKDFNQILVQYDLGNVIQSEPVSAGTVQTTYIVRTTKSNCVFRYYENRTTPSVLFESELLTFLQGHQYPCPQPLPDKQGSTVHHYLGKPYMLLSFLPGQSVENPTSYHQGQLIQHAAWLQNLTENYRPRNTPGRWNYNPELCRELANAAAQKIGTREASKKYAWLENQLANLDLPERHPKGICHCDFHFSNVLFEGDRFVGLIDFDDANYTYLSFDLVGLIDSWAWPYPSESLIREQARQIAQAYGHFRSLHELEKRHLFDVHKLSILFDSIWFFQRGSADNAYERKKIEYLDALGRDGYEQALFSA